MLSAFLAPLLVCEFRDGRNYNYAFLVLENLANSLE